MEMIESWVENEFKKSIQTKGEMLEMNLKYG